MCELKRITLLPCPLYLLDPPPHTHTQRLFLCDIKFCWHDHSQEVHFRWMALAALEGKSHTEQGWRTGTNQSLNSPWRLNRFASSTQSLGLNCVSVHPGIIHDNVRRDALLFGNCSFLQDDGWVCRISWFSNKNNVSSMRLQQLE